MRPLLQSGAVGVTASAARDEAVPVAMRAGSPVRAGAWPEDGDDLVAIWHTHELHQLLYAFEGVAEVETDGSHHLLPPQQAAWIPAGLPHQTTLRKVRTVAVFFEPSMVPGHGDRVRVLSAAAPVREMIVYAARWRIDRPASDPTADAFFTALALLTAEWLDTAEAPLRLPTSSVPVVAAVMRHTQEHLAEVDERSVCAAVGVSERALRRTFRAETGVSWSEYRTTSRVLRAMTMLAEHDRSILDTATAVGFGSLSGFDRAFRRLTGERPADYRRRIRDAARRDVPDVGVG
jgi:AraC-like DNA-binding protein/mannose-6-phosphate isomerase-like protein (cupin superfamily)